MRVNHRQRAHLFMLAGVFGLIIVTLYMAFASPFSLMHLTRQSETTELKAVILIGRHGEVTPASDAFFEAYDEEPPEQWFTLGGPNQLTNVGKERMYLLGRFLRLRYHDKLLNGNPRRLLIRSENSDKCLESAQSLVAGLNQPVGSWLWSTAGGGGGGICKPSGLPCDELAKLWQPKAVHTTNEQLDDMLSSRTRCLVMDSLRAHWKNSTRYALMLNEFRHDLQILRQNTGLEFEDDLEMLASIEEQLRSRASFALETAQGSPAPAWYTSTFASRLAHVADAAAGCRFSQTATQRLFVGRLLDAITKNIFGKIRADLTSGLSLLGGGGGGGGGGDGGQSAGGDETPGHGASQADENDPTFIDFNKTREEAARAHALNGHKDEQELFELKKNRLLPPEERAKLKLAHLTEPNVFLYMTDKNHLTALLHSLKIFSSQPHYGSLLIIELHYDATNQMHFLRLFTVNSVSHNVLPEPVRVNPIACLDSVECSPQQFERNIRHLRLDKQLWQQACQAADDASSAQTLNVTPAGPPVSTPDAVPATTEPPRSPVPQARPQVSEAEKRPPASNNQQTGGPKSDKLDSTTQRSDTSSTAATPQPLSPALPSNTPTPATPSSDERTGLASTTNSTTSPSSTTTIMTSNHDDNGDNDDDDDDDGEDGLKKDGDDENLLVGPTNTRPISSGHQNKTKPGADEPLATAIPSTLVEVDKSTARTGESSAGERTTVISVDLSTATTAANGANPDTQTSNSSSTSSN